MIIWMWEVKEVEESWRNPCGRPIPPSINLYCFQVRQISPFFSPHSHLCNDQIKYTKLVQNSHIIISKTWLFFPEICDILNLQWLSEMYLWCILFYRWEVRSCQEKVFYIEDPRMTLILAVRSPKGHSSPDQFPCISVSPSWPKDVSRNLGWRESFNSLRDPLWSCCSHQCWPFFIWKDVQKC